MENKGSKNHNKTSDYAKKCNNAASKEMSVDFVNSKERKEIQNTQILCRTLSGNPTSSSSNRPTSEDGQSNGAINKKIHTSENVHGPPKGNNLTTAINSSSGCSETNISSLELNKCSLQGTADLDSSTSGIAQASVRTKDNCRETRKDFASRRAELQSMEVDEEKPDVKTPVYEDMDPAQAILSHHRLAAYLASPDCPPDCLTPGAASISMPSDEVVDSTVGTGTLSEKPLAVGRCGPELAEAALQSAGTVTRLPNNTVAFVADDLHRKIKLASPSSAGSGASTPLFGHHTQPYLGSHKMGPSPSYTTVTPPQSLALPPYLYSGRLPPLDHTLLNDIEKHARRLATNVDGLIESLTDSLHGVNTV